MRKILKYQWAREGLTRTDSGKAKDAIPLAGRTQRIHQRQQLLTAGAAENVSILRWCIAGIIITAAKKCTVS